MVLREAAKRAASVMAIVKEVDTLLASLDSFGPKIEKKNTTKENFGTRKIELNGLIDLYVQFLQKIRDDQKLKIIPPNCFEDIELERDQVHLKLEVKRIIKNITVKDFTMVSVFGQQVLDNMKRGLRNVKEGLTTVAERVAAQ